MTGIQIAFIHQLQTQAVWFAAPMLLFSLLGQPEFFLLVIAYIYWCSNPRLGLRLGLLMGISGGLNEALKVAFHLPRPYWVSPEVRALASHPSFGLPSGHAQGAMTFWGMIAAESRRRWVSVLVVVLIILIGASRIFLGVHFPADVIAGFAFGLVILIGFLVLEEPVGRRITTLPVSWQILLAFTGSIALALISFAALAALGDWEVPATWVEGALERSGQPIYPLDPRDGVTAAGFFFGFAAGAAAVGPRQASVCITSRTARKRSLRLICCVSGLLVTGVVWFGLGLLVQPDPTPGAYILQYIRAAAAAAWVSCGALMVFAHLYADADGQ